MNPRPTSGEWIVILLCLAAIVVLVFIVCNPMPDTNGHNTTRNTTTLDLDRVVYGQLAAIEMNSEDYVTFYLHGGVRFTCTSDSINETTMPGLNATNLPFDSWWTYVLRYKQTNVLTLIYELELATPGFPEVVP